MNFIYYFDLSFSHFNVLAKLKTIIDNRIAKINIQS